MTVGEWLRARTPEPPQRLRARIDQALATSLKRDACEASDACVDAACELLRDLLAREHSGRESALDLLAVDALITYAFEAACEHPESLAARAEDAMRRLAGAAAAAA